MVPTMASMVRPSNHTREVYWLIDFIIQAQFPANYHRGEEVIEYFDKYWHVSFYYAAAYLILVYLGHRYMAQREPFHLRTVMVFWSGSLAVFSILGSIALWPEFINKYRERGLMATYCDLPAYRDDFRIGYWYVMFVLSKIPELFDTAFIVLRKTKLLTLHWAHHSLALIYSFYLFTNNDGTVRWMVTLNLLVHSMMYIYFTLRAKQIPIPLICSAFITMMQLTQMVLCVAVHGHILWMHFRGIASRDCPTSSLENSIPGFFIYLFFIYIFGNFFINKYFKSSTTTSSTNKDDNKKFV